MPKLRWCRESTVIYIGIEIDRHIYLYLKREVRKKTTEDPISKLDQKIK